MQDAPVTPQNILGLGLAFWGSKVLLSAVEMGLFSHLSKGPGSLEHLSREFSLHQRGARDFLDALVALGMLTRTDGLYANTPETALFLDKAKPTYVGGILEMANARLYPFWGKLSDALRSGQPQNEAANGGDPFDAIYSDPAVLEGFLHAMTGVSLGTAQAIAASFPWADVRSFVDVGCAQGGLSATLARAHPHLHGIGFDLPPVGRVFDAYVARNGLADRVKFVAGSFFTDALPSADVIVMGHILHDWDLDQKRMLLAKAFAALSEGGRLIVYDAIIDDGRSSNAFGLLMSLNMLIETPGGFDYTGADCIGWMRDAGFRDAHVVPLDGPNSMVVATR